MQEETGQPLPDREEMDMPEPLMELLRIERWGVLPQEGGLFNQPYHYIRDLEAAMVGRQRRETAKAVNLKRKDSDADTV